MLKFKGYNRLNGIKKAFTLAEVLITLTIIGIVAAVSIPTMVADHSEKETVARVKKFYTTMEQVYRLAVTEYGPISRWNVPDGTNSASATKFAEYIKPYLNIGKDCGAVSNTNDAEKMGCVYYPIKEGQTKNIRLLNSTSDVSTWYGVNYDRSGIYYKMILTDGTYLWFRTINSYCRDQDGGFDPKDKICALVWIDTNGSDKPNTMGMDIFYLAFTTKGIKLNIKDDCNKNDTGWSCIKYILDNGNMDYLN